METSIIIPPPMVATLQDYETILWAALQPVSCIPLGPIGVCEMKDYIRLGLAVKAKWPQIDFETVEIHEVPFGKLHIVLPILRSVPDIHLTVETEPPLFGQESVEMHRLRGKQVEFMAGYAPVSNRLLIGIKE